MFIELNFKSEMFKFFFDLNLESVKISYLGSLHLDVRTHARNASVYRLIEYLVINSLLPTNRVVGR